MENKRPPLSNNDIEWNTNRAKDRGEDRCAQALGFLLDSDRKKRQDRRECKSCFYFSVGRIGGASMTTWWCGVCGEEQMAGSTHCPRVCKDCSAKYELCCECGGDIHIRIRRKAPLPTSEAERP